MSRSGFSFIETEEILRAEEGVSPLSCAPLLFGLRSWTESTGQKQEQRDERKLRDLGLGLLFARRGSSDGFVAMALQIRQRA